MDNETKALLKSLANELSNLKKELSEARLSRERLKSDNNAIVKKQIEMEMKVNQCVKDVDNLAAQLRAHFSSSEKFRQGVLKIKVQMTYLNWVTSIVGGACIAYIMKIILDL